MATVSLIRRLEILVPSRFHVNKSFQIPLAYVTVVL